jgi:putative hydrolase
VTGFMSLIEGHAEYVMNAVPPSVIPSQGDIERKFAARRRRGANPLDRLLRSLLGMDAKTRQYTQGSQFVRSVVDQIGLDGFNAVWTSKETLPTKPEITAPADWVKRVHG